MKKTLMILMAFGLMGCDLGKEAKGKRNEAVAEAVATITKEVIDNGVVIEPKADAKVVDKQLPKSETPNSSDLPAADPGDKKNAADEPVQKPQEDKKDVADVIETPEQREERLAEEARMEEYNGRFPTVMTISAGESPRERINSQLLSGETLVGPYYLDDVAVTEADITQLEAGRTVTLRVPYTNRAGLLKYFKAELIITAPAEGGDNGDGADDEDYGDDEDYEDEEDEDASDTGQGAKTKIAIPVIIEGDFEGEANGLIDWVNNPPALTQEEIDEDEAALREEEAEEIERLRDEENKRIEADNELNAREFKMIREIDDVLKRAEHFKDALRDSDEGRVIKNKLADLVRGLNEAKIIRVEYSHEERVDNIKRANDLLFEIEFILVTR